MFAYVCVYVCVYKHISKQGTASSLMGLYACIVYFGGFAVHRPPCCASFGQQSHSDVHQQWTKEAKRDLLEEVLLANHK